MKLVTCPDCGKQISDQAPACPSCGRAMALLPEARMKETRLGPYRLIAASLFGFGLFSVVYPAIVWFFAPRRVFAVHHVYFFRAGVVLLLLAALCVWIGRGRVKRH